MDSLPFGPLDARAWLVCIDMQRLFLQPGEWYCPDGLALLPTLQRLVAHAGPACRYTRFITPQTAADAPGCWRRYYRRWASMTRERIGDAALDVHPALAAPADRTVDKTTHDAFASGEFAALVERDRPSALVLCGIETDVCVLATALSAVDRGVRVVVVRDAVASADRAAHDACLRHILPRFDQQIEIVDSAVLLRGWPF